MPATVHYQKFTAYLKIHKLNTPSKIIVSSIGTFHPIAIYLHNIISDSRMGIISTIVSNFTIFTDKKIQKSDILIPLRLCSQTYL